MQRSWAYLLIMCSACVASSSHGHHSPAIFDRSVEIFIEGRIATLEWRNPHVYMTIETAAPGGKTIERRVEAGPPSVLLSLGVTAESLRVGDVVTVRANPQRNGGDGIMLGLDARKADGRVLPLHVQTAATSARPGAARATSIFGTWVGQPAGFLSLWQATASWPLTRKARQAITENRDAMLKSMAECVPVGPPALMVFPVAITLGI